jgi:hypothetical protein
VHSEAPPTNATCCTDGQSAKKVTFDPSIHKRTVTLDGDVFDPAGTLTGGSAPQGVPILKLLYELHELHKQHQQLSQQLARDKQQLADLRSKKESWSQHVNQLSLAQHKAELLKHRLEQSPYHQVLTRQFLLSGSGSGSGSGSLSLSLVANNLDLRSWLPNKSALRNSAMSGHANLERCNNWRRRLRTCSTNCKANNKISKATNELKRKRRRYVNTML